jgi:hypothetical protein
MRNRDRAGRDSSPEQATTTVVVAAAPPTGAQDMSDDDSHLYQAIAHLERELRAALESIDRCVRERGQRATLDGEVGRAAGLAADLQLALTRLGYGEDEEATRAAARSMIHHAFDLAARYRKGLL